MRPALRAALALAALGLLGACARQQEPAGIELLGGWRPGSARLAGFEWAAPGSETLEASRARELRLLARALESEREPRSGETLRLRALLRLASNDLDGAIRWLERARALHPGERTITVDLVASLLERGRRGHRWRDWLGAIELLDELGDSAAEPRFLRAQALESLGLRASARAAWRRVLDGDDDAGWKGEAAARLSALEQPLLEQEWRERRAHPIARQLSLESGPGAIAARAPGLAHDDLFYGGLAAWGGRELAGDRRGADEILALAREVGARLSELGDGALATAVEAIDGVRGERRELLARGHVHLGSGWREIERLDVARARTELESAVRELCAGGSSACAWARYWAAVVSLYDGRFRELEAGFRSLEARADRPLDRRLAAAIARTRGTVALRSTNFAAARESYLKAAAAFESIQDRFNGAILGTYLADVDALLGQADSDWRRRLAAVAELQQTPSSPWLPTVLYGSALSALAAGSPAAALAFVEEDLLALSLLPRLRVDAAEASLLLASLQMRLDDQESATAAIASANQAIQEIPDPDLRSRLEADLDLQLARFEITRDATAALERARRARSRYSDLGVRLPAVELALLEARANLALDRRDLARSHLGQGFRELTAVLAGLDDPYSAASYAELGADLVDELASLELETYGAPEAAFVLLEELRRPASREARPREVPNAESAEATVVYALLPRQLLIAVSTGGIRKTATVSVSRSEVETRCQRLFALLSTRAPEAAIRDEADWLASRLIAPVAAWLPAEAPLVIVADRALNLVPFAALRDPRSDRYLVEEHAIRYAPSERESVRVAGAAMPLPPSPGRTVVLAPAAGSAEGVALPPLPAALREARAVAALYPGARLLEGTRASRDAFLAALRDSDVLHFAGHAEAAPDDPGASRLWLANASDSRRLSPLLASDLMRSGEGGRGLVVLSGCETSLPTPRRRLGGDGYAGALLATGARAVIGTAWAIGDEQAESLFLAFHRHLLTGLDPAEALRRAQIERIRSASEHDRSPTNWAFARLSGV